MAELVTYLITEQEKQGRGSNGRFQDSRAGKTTAKVAELEGRRIMAQFYRARHSTFNAAARVVQSDPERFNIITIIQDTHDNRIDYIGTPTFTNRLAKNLPIIDSNKAFETTINQQLAFIQTQEIKRKIKSSSKKSSSSATSTPSLENDLPTPLESIGNKKFRIIRKPAAKRQDPKSRAQQLASTSTIKKKSRGRPPKVKPTILFNK
jgi:hypothetical protein